MYLIVPGLCGQSVFMTVPHFHAPGETLRADSVFTEPGGKGFNQAVAARRMGARVIFLGAVGNDPDGDACAACLREEGIEAHLFRKAEKTAYAVILTDSSGENRVTVYPGAQLETNDIRAIAPAFSRVRMMLLTCEIPEDVFAKCVSIARKNDIPIVLNPAPYDPWVMRYADSAYLMTPNEQEACGIMECGENELRDALRACRFPRMIVTLGADGALCLCDGKVTHMAAPKVHAADTTGAGDCLSGTLCAYLLMGLDLPEAARKAVLAASLSVCRPHAQSSFPHAWEVQ